MNKRKPIKAPETRLSSPVNPSDSRRGAAARRAILRNLTGSALFVAVSERLPGGWQRPLIKSTALPAHASPSPIAVPVSIRPQASVKPARQWVLSIGGSETIRPFVTTWEVSSDNLNVTIPAVGEELNYRVDWGDGAVDTGQTGYATHAYAAAGTYIIQISGGFKGQTFFGIDDAIQKAGRKQMRSIEQWGDIAWEHLSYAFYDCIHLQVHATDAPDLSRVTSLEGLFLDANSANPSLGHWDISNVTNMRLMLNIAFTFRAENYDALLQGWAAQTVQRNVQFNAETTQYSLAAVEARNTLVSTYGWTIHDAGLTTSLPSGFAPFIIHCEISSDNLRFMIPAVGEGLSYWIDWGDSNGTEHSTGQAEHEYQTAGTYVIQIAGTLKQVVFYQTAGENQLLRITRWGDIEWVSMRDAFANCQKMDITAVDTPDLSKVTSLSGMLALIPSLTVENIEIGDWDISNVTDLSHLFYESTGFDQNIGGWDISSVTTLQNAFDGITFSPHNYDALLTGWSRSDITVPRDLTLSVGETRYSSNEAATARAKLINQYGWTINDGDRAPAPTTAAPGSRAFITTWKVEAGDLSIIIPAYDFDTYTLDYTVVWGDGSVTENATDQTTHTYASAGTYVVQITGQLPWLQMGASDGTNRKKLRTIEQWGNIEWHSMESAFDSCTRLRYTASDVPNSNNVANMRRMFRGATDFDGNLNDWDVSNVTNMDIMFWGASNFNGYIDGWDVSNVTSMPGMFQGATAFNQNLNSWNVSNVTNMRSMFSKATSFNGDISSWKVGNVTNMYEMFYRASRFNRDISGWNVENVTTMYRMFVFATRFDRNLGGWNVGNVSNMWAMLFGVTLSPENYNALLVGWADLDTLKRNLTLHANSCRYSTDEAEQAKGVLETTWGWRIIDAGRSTE